MSEAIKEAAGKPKVEVRTYPPESEEDKHQRTRVIEHTEGNVLKEIIIAVPKSPDIKAPFIAGGRIGPSLDVVEYRIEISPEGKVALQKDELALPLDSEGAIPALQSLEWAGQSLEKGYTKEQVENAIYKVRKAITLERIFALAEEISRGEEVKASTIDQQFKDLGCSRETSTTVVQALGKLLAELEKPS